MLSRDILEQQELEFALSLIEDMEREAELEQNNGQQTEEQHTEKHTEQHIDPGEEETNPSPKTLRNMRRAYYEALEVRRGGPLAELTTEAVMQTQPAQTQPAQTQPAQTQPAQTQPAIRRLRSGRSY